MARPTLLIVEDSPRDTQLWQCAFESAGIAAQEVVFASDGAEALGILLAAHDHEGGIRLVVTDQHMPHLSGSDLICCMHDDVKLRATPVVVVTGALRHEGPVAPSGWYRKPARFGELVTLARALHAQALAGSSCTGTR
ncbi:MAG: response regulator [Planctomycetes bacterium]|nr:response regulator [Planctomycetota bacterium]